MNKELFKIEYEKIVKDHISYQKIINDRYEHLLRSVVKDISDYFLSKGFVHQRIEDENYIMKERNYYYDPKTKIGVRIDIPLPIDIDFDYSTISLSIVYKVQENFLDYQKKVMFLFKREEPEEAFSRFKKYNGKTELERMKDFLRRYYPQEMLIADRNEKLKNIKKL